jgi:release factor glutamine methyltransferase
MRPAEVIRRGTDYLARHGVEGPRANAEALMMRVLDADRATVLARNRGLSTAEARAFGRALCLRCGGTPLQYLTGEQGFRRLVVEVRPGVFVPRPETEIVVEVALTMIADVTAPAIADVCTGAGPIALALKDERPDARVWATDVSAEAVVLARANAARLAIEVDVREGDLLAPLPPELRGALDLVVANPPYVPLERAAHLPADVTAEPALALFGGIDLYERLLAQASEWLRPNGAFTAEIDDTYGAAVSALAAGLGFHDVRVLRDLAQRDRVIAARRPA